MPNPEALAQSQLFEGLRNRVLAGVLMASAFLGPNVASETAQADTGPNPPVTIGPSNTTGPDFAGARAPSMKTGPDGHPVMSFIAGQDVMMLDCGDKCAEGNVVMPVEKGVGFGSIAEMIVSPTERAVLYNLDGNQGSVIAKYTGVAGELFDKKAFAGKVGGFSSKTAPDGTVGVAYTLAGQKKLHYREYDSALESFTDVTVTEVPASGDVSLDYNPITGRPEMAFHSKQPHHSQGDAMVALCQDTCDVDSATPPIVTALDTVGDVGGEISVAATPNGLRASYQKSGEGALRAGACLDAEDCDVSGATSATVDGEQSTAIGTSMELLANESLGILAGASGENEGLRFAVCPEYREDPEDPNSEMRPADCTNVNYLVNLDPSGVARDPSYLVNANQEAIAAYASDSGEGGATLLKVISGPTPTFGIDMEQDGQSTQADNNSGDRSANTQNPIENIRLASDLKYVVGSQALKACRVATSNAPQCDNLWLQ